MRIDRYFSSLGICSRSEIKKELKHHLVKVNDKIITSPEFNVTDSDIVKYKDEIIKYEEYVYYIFNKPAGYVCARKDNLSETILELIDDLRKDLSPVGRLDKDTEGLIIVTNDGKMLHDLMSPKKHVSKTYYAEIDGIVSDMDVIKFKDGVDIGDEKPTLPAELKVLEIDEDENTSKIEITIYEGRYHQVKRMFEAIDTEVTYLKRIAIGKLKLDKDLKTGEYIKIQKDELLNLIF